MPLTPATLSNLHAVHAIDHSTPIRARHQLDLVSPLIGSHGRKLSALWAPNSAVSIWPLAAEGVATTSRSANQRDACRHALSRPVRARTPMPDGAASPRRDAPLRIDYADQLQGSVSFSTGRQCDGQCAATDR